MSARSSAVPAIAPPLQDTFANTRELLEAAAELHGERDAYVEPGSRVSFAQWVSRARSVAAHFAALGVGRVMSSP